MSQPAIILVNPQMGENIGGSARAMLNCGLSDLKLINPRDGWPNERANAMSSGALEKMPEVEIFPNTEDALKPYHHVYATTARPRDMVKPVLTAEETAKDIKKRVSSGQKCAILFGGERAGLSNDDVALSHSIVTIPLNPDFSSLNLSQAVLLLSYEWSKQNYEAEHNEETDIADHDQLNAFFKRLEESLEEKNFFREEHRQANVMRNIRNMITRGELTQQELKTYHGILSSLIQT